MNLDRARLDGQLGATELARDLYSGFEERARLADRREVAREGMWRVVDSLVDQVSPLLGKMDPHGTAIVRLTDSVTLLPDLGESHPDQPGEGAVRLAADVSLGYFDKDANDQGKFSVYAAKSALPKAGGGNEVTAVRVRFLHELAEPLAFGDEDTRRRPVDLGVEEYGVHSKEVHNAISRQIGMPPTEEDLRAVEILEQTLAQQEALLPETLEMLGALATGNDKKVDPELLPISAS